MGLKGGWTDIKVAEGWGSDLARIIYWPLVHEPPPPLRFGVQTSHADDRPGPLRAD